MYTARTLVVLAFTSLVFGAIASTLTSLNVGRGSIVETNPIMGSLLNFVGNFTVIVRSLETLAGFFLLVMMRESIQKRGLTKRWWLAIDFPALFLTTMIFLDMINDVSVSFYGVNLFAFGFIVIYSLELTAILTLVTKKDEIYSQLILKRRGAVV